MKNNTRTHIGRIQVAAKQGDSAAQWTLGLMFEHGYGIPADLNEAIKWYKRAAGNDLPIAQFELAHIYWEGRGVAANIEKGTELLTKAAENGLAVAQYMLAMNSGWGFNSEKFEQARVWMERAAESGNAEAAVALGVFCKQGHTSHEARLWFERAETLEPGSAADCLALFYAEGIGVPKDDAKAVELYKKAAEWGSAGACFTLADAYSTGRMGLLRDQAKADEYMERYRQLEKRFKELWIQVTHT